MVVVVPTFEKEEMQSCHVHPNYSAVAEGFISSEISLGLRALLQWD